LVVAACVALAGCASGQSGGDSPTPSPSASSMSSATDATSGAPEDQRTSAAAVAAGLRNIQVIAGQIARTAASDKGKAMELSAQIEPRWQPIEGTVKANDQDAYLAFEDAFALLEIAAKDGDGAKAAK